MSNQGPVDEGDIATITLIVAICDSLIDADQIDVEGLLKSLSAAEVALDQQKWLIAASIVERVRSSLIDPDRSKSRHLSLVPAPNSGDEQ